MAEASSRGGRKGGAKRKKACELIRIESIKPIIARAYEYTPRGGRTVALKSDFISACGGRGVYVERLFDGNFLESINFPYVQRFKEWNWWPFLFHNNDALTNVVKVFYFRGDNGIYARNEEEDEDVRVGEKEMSFQTTVLGELLNVDETFVRRYLGNVPAGPSKVPNPADYPYEDACREIYNDWSIQGFETDASKMGLYNRILHLIVCQVLDLKAGGYAKATHDNIWWMHRIIHNDPPNLAAMIVRNMLDAVKNSKTNQNDRGLPYGRLVSRICDDQCAVHENEPVTPPEFKKPFGKKSLIKLGWKFDERTGTFFRKDAPAEEAVTLDSLMSEMRRMHTENMGAMSSFNDRFVALEQQQVLLQQQQVVLSQQNQRIYDEFRAFQHDAANNDPFPSFPSSSN